MGMKTYLHCPMDFAKTLKLRFRVGNLDLPERRKRYASSREEEGVDALMCPCGKAIEISTHLVGQCEMRKEERDMFEEKRDEDECDMEELHTLYISEKTIATRGDRGWPKAANQEVDKSLSLQCWDGARRDFTDQADIACTKREAP